VPSPARGLLNERGRAASPPSSNAFLNIYKHQSNFTQQYASFRDSFKVTRPFVYSIAITVAC